MTVMGSMRRIFAPALVSFALMTSSSYFVSALMVAVTRYLHSILLAIFLSPKLNAQTFRGEHDPWKPKPSTLVRHSSRPEVSLNARDGSIQLREFDPNVWSGRALQGIFLSTW
jgi:hypothetical protein